MVNIYTEFRDKNGFVLTGRTKLFIIEVLEDGSIHRSVSGLAYTIEENGTQFIVDDWLINQLDKIQFIDGVLSVKSGEELIPPAKTEKEKMIEEMERQLAALKAEPDEHTDTEEETDFININTADFNTLLTLTGIGETKANAITDYRTEQGEFTDTEDIMHVPGIGPVLYEGFKNEMTV